MYFANNADTPATLGLLGTPDSLSYRAAEADRHMHGWDRRFGAAVTPSGETHVADLLGPSVVAFTATSGNNTWGSWLQILGSSDTPALSGSVKFDPHNILVTDANYAGLYFCQICYGESADLAAKVTAKTYSAHVYNGSASVRTQSVPIMFRRMASGTKIWFRCMVPGQNGKTISFFMGMHEYEG